YRFFVSSVMVDSRSHHPGHGPTCGARTQKKREFCCYRFFLRARTRTSPAMPIAPVRISGHRGDWVVVGQGVTSVLMGLSVVGIVVGACVAGAVTVKVTFPMYPLASRKSTS